MLIRYPLFYGKVKFGNLGFSIGKKKTVNNKRLISNAKKSEKKYAYTNAMVLLRITKAFNS